MEFTVEEAALRGGGTFTNNGANPAEGGATPGGATAGGGGGGGESNGSSGTPAGGGSGNITPPGAAWNPNHVMRNLEADHVPVDEEEEQAMARIVRANFSVLFLASLRGMNLGSELLFVRLLVYLLAVTSIVSRSS